MVANSVRVGGRDIAAVVRATVRRAVKGSEKSNALFSTITITIFRAYLKMSNGSQNMVEVSSCLYIPLIQLSGTFRSYIVHHSVVWLKYVIILSQPVAPPFLTTAVSKSLVCFHDVISL